MYHHLHNTRTNFNSMKFSKFKKQINYLRKKFNILSPKEFYKKIKSNNIRENDCVITFDDGYISQYRLAHSLLHKLNIKAFYFPITSLINKKKLHSINKIQLICNSCKDKNKLLNILMKYLDKKYKNLLYKNLKVKIFSYDDQIVRAIKNLLQKLLPFNEREKIIKILFKKFVKSNIEKKQFYMKISHLKRLKKRGNEIGVHTDNHFWLSSLKKEKQENEIKKSYKFLLKNKLINKYQWSFCYPYGDYNGKTLRILKKMNCDIAFTTHNQLTDLDTKLLEIKRLDCNEIYPII